MNTPVFNMPLKSSLDLNALKADGTEFELEGSNMDLEDDLKSLDLKTFDKKQLSENLCLMSDDEEEDVDDDSDQYLTELEKLKRKLSMIKNSDISPYKDGGILKQIKKPGAGKLVPEGSAVTVHYNAYTDVGQAPYDSTHLQGEPRRLRIGKSSCMLGLHYAILSMAKGEISRFIIHHDYGYGEMGCPPRIPGKATLIFDVELLNFTELNCLSDYYDLTPEERRIKMTYADIENVVNAETAEAKQYFVSKSYQKAANYYQRALSILEEYHLKNEEEERLWTKQMMRVSMNNAMCHYNLKHFGRTIHHCNVVLKTDKSHVKANYFKAKALHGLGQLQDAKKHYKIARNLDPTNKTILTAIDSLERSIKEEALFEKNLCQKMFSKPAFIPKPSKMKEHYSTSQESEPEQTCSQNFKQLVEEQFKKFQNDDDMTEMPFPSFHMSPAEISCILETAEKLGLEVKQRGTGSQIKYLVQKKTVKIDVTKEAHSC